jgi:hypothetical protein
MDDLNAMRFPNHLSSTLPVETSRSYFLSSFPSMTSTAFSSC